MASLTSAEANAVLDARFKNWPGGTWISLHTADPGDTGANEVVGGSYARQPIAWSTATGRSTSNSATVTWTGLPAIPSMAYCCIWTAVSGGSCKATLVQSPAVAVANGGALTINAGAAVITA